MPSLRNSPDPVILGKKILEIVTSTWIEAKQFDDIADYMRLPAGAPKVDFTQRLLALIKRLPQKVLDQEARDKILEIGQEYLDSIIEEEEDLEDKNEEE